MKTKKDWCEGGYEQVHRPSKNYSQYRIPSEEEEEKIKKDQQKKVRCPVCNKRLKPCARWNDDGDFDGWAVPKHKEK